jgi:hypothetical protein
VLSVEVNPCPTELNADTLTTTKALNTKEYGVVVKTLIGMIHHSYVFTGDVAPLQSVVSDLKRVAVVASYISIRYAVIEAPFELA